MKILYAIQGTGNGHISRARDIIPILQEKGELDILVSGTQADVALGFPVKYSLHGFGFVFGKKGGVDISETYRKANLHKFREEIIALPVEDYDIVITDFEPVSAWACYLKHLPCVGLSHQAAVLHPNAAHPKTPDPVGRSVLKYYAPTTKNYGFHFARYDDMVFTPVIRQQVRNMTPVNEGHYTVYLPAYSDERIIKVLSLFPEVRWQVFSKHNKTPLVQGNISVSPVSNEAFMQSMATSAGMLCGAGFETPAEALFLKKKLLVIPMKGQYEQGCNAAALKKLGIPVIKKLSKKRAEKISAWLKNDQIPEVNYPDETRAIIDRLLAEYPEMKPATKKTTGEISSTRRLKNFMIKKVLRQLAG